MRTLMRGGIVGIVLWALLPTDAAAAIGWLEKLSGPGPFVGVMVPVSLACYGENLDTGTAAQPNQGQAGREPDLGLFVDFQDCLDANTRGPRVTFAVQFGRLWSQDNNLPYAGVPRGEEPGVRIFLLIPAISTPVTRFLDVGAGLGFAHFSAEADAFDGFVRGAIQPVRLTVKPLSFFKLGRRWESVELRLNATVFTGRFTASDFGATGPFDERGELLWERILYVDVLKLFSSEQRQAR